MIDVSIVFRLIASSIKCQKIVNISVIVSQSPKWSLQFACVIRPTVRNQNIQITMMLSGKKTLKISKCSAFFQTEKCPPDWNNSTTIIWIDIKSSAGIHAPQRMILAIPSLFSSISISMSKSVLSSEMCFRWIGTTFYTDIHVSQMIYPHN